MNSKKLIQWALIFFVIFGATQYYNNKKNAATTANNTTAAPIVLTPTKLDYTQGTEVAVKVTNNTQAAFTIESKCPTNPLTVKVFNGTTFEEKTAVTKLSCSRLPAITVEPGKTVPVSFKYWNNALFTNPGRYQVSLTLPTTPQPVVSPEFVVSEAGSFRLFFRTVFYRPLLNALVWIITVMPFHDLGLSTIIITLLIRLLLLIPSQRALISQRKMQALQPRLEKIKKEFAGNQEKIAQETFKLWKENKVNPFGSCLPLLIQFPFLIAIFYVIQSGLNPDNANLLYGSLKNFDFNSMNTMFLGVLDLTRVNMYVLPLIVGALQFIQMKLSFAKKNTGKKIIEIHEDKKPNVADEMAKANRSMMYVMPIMIALFTASVPAGVGLYWGVSTLFAVGQQLVVNKKV